MLTIWIVPLVLAALAVSFANGANDNAKGVATLLGATILRPRLAIWWGTAATLLGSLASLALASSLVKTFSGKGIVPDALTSDPTFLSAVALGGAATVLVATGARMPISTTHALVGSLLGAGLVYAPDKVAIDRLWETCLLPLAVSPLVAIAATLPFCGALHLLKRTMATTKVGRALDIAHVLSAGLVSAARGLNDTPKIFGLLYGIAFTGGAIGLSVEEAHSVGLLLVGGSMALGGILSALRVGETLSERVTAMTNEQALVGNLTTAALVIGASLWGSPVSTTHVSTSTLFGIRLSRGAGRGLPPGRSAIRPILAAWVLTLPVAALLAGGIAALERNHSTAVVAHSIWAAREGEHRATVLQPDVRSPRAISRVDWLHPSS